MANPNSNAEPIRIAEPRTAPEFSDAISRVAAEGRPLIVQRDGRDIAALITVDQMKLLNDAVAHQNAEALSGEIDWNGYVAKYPPPQSWFDGDEPKPF